MKGLRQRRNGCESGWRLCEAVERHERVMSIGEGSRDV